MLDLKRIIWIGGSSGAGKTTLSNKLNHEYGITVYHCDEHYKEHIAMAQESAYMIKKLAPMTEDAFWMRAASIQYEEMIQFYREEFILMLCNLQRRFSQYENLIVEGCILLPGLLRDIPVDKKSMVFLVPTESFHRYHHLHSGEWVHHILSQCKNPNQAYENWMQRDTLFSEYIMRECEKMNFKCILVSENRSIEKTYEEINAYLNILS